MVISRRNGLRDCQHVVLSIFMGPSRLFSVIPNGATEGRAEYAAEPICVESIRPIPCRLRAIANIYKGLFRLPFVCGAKKEGLGGEAEALAKIGTMQPAVAVSLQSRQESAKRSLARTQGSPEAAWSLLRSVHGNPARPCLFQVRWPSKQ